MEKIRKLLPIVVILVFISFFIVYALMTKYSSNYYRKIVIYCYMGFFITISILYFLVMIYAIIHHKELK